MYRPKEPDARYPGATHTPLRGEAPSSLLDLIERGTTRSNLDAYRRMAVSGHVAQPEPRLQPDDRPAPTIRDESTDLHGHIQAQITSLRQLGPADIILWIKHRLHMILIGMAVGILLAFAYAFTASPRFTVYTDLIIDPQNLNVVANDVLASSPQRDAQLLEVESRLRVLTSRNVLRKVIDDLNLTEDPEFTKPGLLDPILRLVSGPASPEDRQLVVLRQLSERVQAMREERSFVVVLSVWSEDPDKAVLLSNSIISAFEAELFHAESKSAGRVAAGLMEGLDELRKAVTEAEEKVEVFRRDNDLQATAGELANSRISALLDTQVIEAQQRLIQVEAQYGQMQAAVSSGQAMSATVLNSPTMTTLRSNYNALKQEIGSLSRTYGARHPRLIAMQSEEITLENTLAEEAQRILQAVRTDVEQAQAAFEELRSRAMEERTTVYTNNNAQVRLRELQRDAEAKAAVYETFLARTHQINERQQINTTNVRVISPAVPPQSKSWPPRTVILLTIGALTGAIIGIGLTLMLGLIAHARMIHARMSRQPAS